MFYADYPFYAESYQGTAIPNAEWDAFCVRASAHIDCHTFGRLKCGASVTDDVRMAVCAVAEALKKQQAEPMGIKSENVDGYSVTYADNAAARHNAEITAAVDLWIPRCDPLRYAGV